MSYALNHIVDTMLNTTDHVTYNSAEALLMDYIQSHPIGQFWEINWWSCETWSVILLYAGFAGFGLYYFRRSRIEAEAIRRLTLVVAGSRMLLPRAEV
jgi:hypothetical protein